jgi:hypothetical protein
MLNPKEKNIVFGSIQFNLEIWIELNIFEFNSSCIMQIHSILNHSNGTSFSTKSIHLLHQIVLHSTA